MTKKNTLETFSSSSQNNSLTVASRAEIHDTVYLKPRTKCEC